MGIKYRDELVGKRFLCVSGPGKLKISKICEWNWRAGIIRAVDKNGGTTGTEAETATVYVEFDGQDWQKREWMKIHDNSHHAFLVEKTIILSQRIDPYGSKHSTLLWPALNFEPLVDRVGVKDAKLQPVEFFLDKHLGFSSREEIKVFQEDSSRNSHQSVFNRYKEVKDEVDNWLHDQKVYDILMKAAYSLTGYRVQVYRRGSTTQWFSAVITGHDLYTRELVVMDDTVLESHTENPAHVQMMFLDDVVNSLLKGENVGITPRRRGVNNPATTTNTTSFSRPIPRSHSPSHASTQQNQGTSKAKNEQNSGAGSKKSKRSKLSDVPEQPEPEKEKEKKEKPEKEAKDKSSKEKPSSHKSKKERKRKQAEEKIVEETKKSQTPPKRPRSQPGSADESLSQERVKEAKKDTKSVKTRAKTPEKEEKKEETKEETKKEKRHSERHSDKNKSEKSEEKKSKHHHKHKKDKNKDKEHTKEGDSAVEGGEKTKHKSKHKHHKSEKKEKHKKEEAALAAQAAASAAQVAAATAAATAAAAAAAAASAVSTAPPTVVKQSDTTTVKPPTSNAAPNVAVSCEPTCTKANTDRMPLLNTSSPSEASLTPNFPPRSRLNTHVVPSVATVANIVRDTAATLERVIVNELKKTDNIPPDNGKLILSDTDRSRSRTSPSGVLENNRRYPPHINPISQPSVTVPSTTAAAAIYATSTSASSLHLSSVSNFTTATTTTVTSSIPPSSSSTLSVAPSFSSSSHWSSPVPNPIQVISRTNAISPLAPGSKPPVVTVSGIVKSEDIKRTLPITSEGVEGHKPKEREKESVSIPRPEPVHIGSIDKDKYSHLRDPIDDLVKRELLSRDSERGQDVRERYRDAEERPLASALKEPIQVYRDPNLNDTEVIHVNSVQHQLAYQPHQRAVADPSPTHSQLSAAAVAASQHSTLHPTSTLAAGGLGASGPSAFVPSAAIAGRIPSHHQLARHPMFSSHVQAALYQQHPLAQAAGHLPATAYPTHLAVLNQHDLATRQHIAGLLHHQESVARLQHHPGVFAQLQHAANAAAALQGMHPGMSAAQLQQLWQQQQAAASGMQIPPTWILQQHHEELERQQQHLHQQQQQQSEKSPSVAHAAVAHHEKPRTPHTPQPASASSSHSQRDISSASSRESSTVRHYQESSDAQAAVQRHFQESLRKLQLPYTFSASPSSGSGSITQGTAIPKTEPGQHKDQLDRQNKMRIDEEDRLRKEREEKELEWVRLQREKHHPQHREMDIRLQAEKVAGSMSHLERERYNKLHSNDSRTREEALYRHQQEAAAHQRHLENERLRQLDKNRQIGSVAVKQEPGLDTLGRGGEGVHGYQMYHQQRLHYGNMGAYEDKQRAGAVARTEHAKQPSMASQMKDSLIGYQPFKHSVAGEMKEHIKVERTEPHRPVAVPAALAGKPRKDMPSPPPLIHRDETGKPTDPIAHTSVIQGRERRDGHPMHPATTIALGAPPHSVVASQAGKLPHEVVDSRTASVSPHNVPVIVQHGQHGAGIGHPPPLHMRLSPGSTRQHTSPSAGAPPQQVSPVDLHKKMQPLTTAPSHSTHQPMYTMSYTSPTQSTTSTQHSLLLTALRPGEGGQIDGQNPGKRKPGEVSPDPNRKKSKKSNELPNVNSNSNKPMGRSTYGDYYQSFIKDSRNSQITGGTATEAVGRDAQGGKNQENVELKIEKVDQYRKMNMDPSAPGAMLSTESIVQHRFNNGALSDSDSTRSCSPKGSESSERSTKTGSPNRPGGYVNLKKKWLIQHSTDKQATVPPPSGDKLANSSTALDLKSGLPASQDSAESRLSQSLPNGHLQRGAFNPHVKSEKGLSSVTLADIPPKSIPDHVYDFDNSSTCSDSSTTSHKSKKHKKEAKKLKKQHKHKRSHDESKHHKDKHKGEKRACLDMEGAKALSKDREVRLTEDGRVPAPGAQSLVDMMNVSGNYNKSPKKMILTRGRKEKDKDVLNVSRALVKPSVNKLKKTGEPFLQDGACCEVTPNLMKCRECRMKPSSKQSKMNIFCRFYAFRRLRYSKNGNLTIAGFSEPDQCEQEDLAPWLPFPPDAADTKCLDVNTSRYILEKVGDQFCQLVGQEEEAKSWNPANGQNKIAWKRAVTGVREMCDTCDTTLFNIHWTCQKCGFVVCLDCYRTRKTGTAKVPKDKQSWLRCIKEQPHMPENLMLTQIIPGSALWDVGRLVHTLRAQLGITSACKCKWSNQRRQSTPTSESQEQTPAVNGVSPTMMKENNPLATAGVDRKDTKSPGCDSNKEVKLTSFPPSSNSSPLNLLADVASTQSDAEQTQDSTKYSYDQQTLPDTKAATITTDTPSDVETSRSSTLRELLTKTAGKLGRPTTAGLDGSSFLTAFLPHRSENANKKQFGTMTSTFEDIIATVVEQNIAAPTMKHDRTSNMISRPGRNQCQQTMDLSMFTNPNFKLSMTASAVRHTLTETSVLYPDVPHSWLQDGRLLRLHDPKHKGNFRIFQNQWLRGEPVIVSNLHKTLNSEIWKPEWFGNKFGHVANDLVNCLTGALIQGHEMKDFWDGFSDISNRLVSKQGEVMSMKLKDWPPTEDFAETLPEHFIDLMHNLPLPEYSRRDGRLNLSSRLPDFFVKPDLGPKMYNAYGNCQHPTQGTTNLHLDISDAVNVMVHVTIPKCDPENTDVTEEDLTQAGMKIVDEACTDEQTRRRIRDGKEKPGALWHIFRAEDADKIRELLNKVAREQGEDIPDDHDPIHDQSWYLDKALLERLHKEHNVQGWAIAQCHGDAVFIPAGAPHQVQNLHSCIKVAEDFVSPEHISHCFDLTQEFRRLSDNHSNHEDKLQIKNMIYHAVKDAAGVLVSQEIPSPNAASH